MLTLDEVAEGLCANVVLALAVATEAGLAEAIAAKLLGHPRTRARFAGDAAALAEYLRAVAAEAIAAARANENTNMPASSGPDSNARPAEPVTTTGGRD